MTKTQTFNDVKDVWGVRRAAKIIPGVQTMEPNTSQSSRRAARPAVEYSLSAVADPVTAPRVRIGHDFAYVGVVAANENDARGKFSIDKRPALEARAKMGWVRHGKQAKWELIHLGPKDPGIFPAIQGAGSTGPGYFVSTTSAVANDSLAEWDQNRYVNANEIPYGAWAGWWRSLGVGLGDFGVTAPQ
jgi:hypothetical protein